MHGEMLGLETPRVDKSAIENHMLVPVDKSVIEQENREINALVDSIGECLGEMPSKKRKRVEPLSLDAENFAQVSAASEGGK